MFIKILSYILTTVVPSCVLTLLGPKIGTEAATGLAVGAAGVGTRLMHLQDPPAKKTP